MLIKFCENKYNLAKGCSTLGLGTLKSYEDDDQNNLRYDNEEGLCKIQNNGVPMHIGGFTHERNIDDSKQIFGVVTPPGARYATTLQFPNCYVFCCSLDVNPSIEMAKKLDPAYNDWFAITDINKFATQAGQFLLSQITIIDLDLPEDVSIEYLKGISIKIIHRQCSYVGRKLTFNSTPSDQLVHLDNSLIQFAFTKEPNHAEFNEYRILYVINDAYGNIIPVKKKAKVINLLPDLGLTVCEVPTNE